MNAIAHAQNLSTPLGLVCETPRLVTSVSAASPMMAAAAPLEARDQLFDLVGTAPDVFRLSVYAAIDTSGDQPSAYVGMTDTGNADGRLSARIFDPDAPLPTVLMLVGIADMVARSAMTAVEAVLMGRLRAVGWRLQNIRMGECHAGVEARSVDVRVACQEADRLIWDLGLQAARAAGLTDDEGGPEGLGMEQALACEELFALRHDGLEAFLGTVGGRRYLLAGSELSSHHQVSLDPPTRRMRRSLRQLGLLRPHPIRADALIATQAILMYDASVAARLVTGRATMPASAWVPCNRLAFARGM